ncbi:MAG: LysM peptidoglycan-binding domain-containing protein [Nocardioides sp.]
MSVTAIDSVSAGVSTGAGMRRVTAGPSVVEAMGDAPVETGAADMRIRGRGRPRVGAPSSGRLRLTRRGKALLLALGVVLFLAISVLIGSGSIASNEAAQPAPTKVIVVADGVTLWDIASEIAARTDVQDVRDVMSDIEELNALESSMLQAGQKLRVPVVTEQPAG